MLSCKLGIAYQSNNELQTGVCPFVVQGTMRGSFETTYSEGRGVRKRVGLPYGKRGRSAVASVGVSSKAKGTHKNALFQNLATKA